ncbi:uncharacterized protein MONOS_2709 [Monocercomonoides exilis]|uniref:uncharacterized protein n=1 Tax=Monocercomonoides exilis TaxID=2049356 RepID=UPI003559AF65|nr:hypothetical protein MONOS_2709 [Monocercomonoides exilis]|eukprot:MONOS_2709.1-p1 / transcript=MONOS_2709.1 / gene=MONOS_2709 / organism=Monocercomonoides_exilis_PA203 / gene_product=unspecified product / transcript_product=unspecified product / location=Mono_scaffold00057:66573-68007(+) / protein_length=445 / sequence_SO=supercontig / SO=protein_coding / is_pseudo=false
MTSHPLIHSEAISALVPILLRNSSSRKLLLADGFLKRLRLDIARVVGSADNDGKINNECEALTWLMASFSQEELFNDDSQIVISFLKSALQWQIEMNERGIVIVEVICFSLESLIRSEATLNLIFCDEVLQRLIELFSVGNYSLVEASLRVVGTMIYWGNEVHTEKILAAEALQNIRPLISSTRTHPPPSSLICTALRILSNIACGSVHHANALFESNLIPWVICLLLSEIEEEQKEAFYVIESVAEKGADLLKQLGAWNVVGGVCQLIEKLKTKALEEDEKAEKHKMYRSHQKDSDADIRFQCSRIGDEDSDEENENCSEEEEPVDEGYANLVLRCLQFLLKMIQLGDQQQMKDSIISEEVMGKEPLNFVEHSAADCDMGVELPSEENITSDEVKGSENIYATQFEDENGIEILHELEQMRNQQVHKIVFTLQKFFATEKDIT